MKNRRKKAVCCVASVLTVAVAMPGVASAAVMDKCGGKNVAVANVDDALLVRDSASASGKVVGYVPSAAGVIVQGMGQQWTKIRSGSISGYVKTDYLAFDEKADELKNVYGVPGAVAAWDDVKVFADSEDTSSIIGTINEGEGFEVLGSTEEWVEIQLADGNMGYVAVEDVELTRVLDTAVAIDETAGPAEKQTAGEAQDSGAQAVPESDSADEYVQADDDADLTDALSVTTGDASAWEDSAADSWTDDSAADVPQYEIADNGTANGTDGWSDDGTDWSDDGTDWTDDGTGWSDDGTDWTDDWSDDGTDWTDDWSDDGTDWSDDGTDWTDDGADWSDDGTDWTDDWSDDGTDDADDWIGDWTDDAQDNGSSAGVSYSDSDLDLLAALIYCEAGNQSAEGKVAVGQVVMNRVASESFANSIHDVIYESGQFTPASTGWLDSVIGSAPQDCYDAAQAALNGEGSVGDALYFNTGSGKGQKIGAHQFY